MSSHAALSAAADDRKARLAKLKSLKRKQPGADDDDDEQPQQQQQHPQPPSSEPAVAAPHDTTTTTTLPRPNSPTPPTTDVARLHLSGRNYDPSTRGAKLGFEAPPTLGLAGPTLEEQARELEAASRAQQEQEQEGQGAGGVDAGVGSGGGGGIDLFKLQPKKPNWDLKRELAARMEVLNVRTENAIARLVRERLAEKKQAAAAAGAKGGEGEGEGDAEADGMLDGAAIVEGIRLREREEEEEARREREAEAEEFAVAA